VAVRRRPAPRAPGQHFLRSSRLARDLVRDAALPRGGLAVDLGAGTGVLTRALAESGARVLAVELDPRLADELRRRFSGCPVDVVEADACDLCWPDEPFSVVANLPFAGSGAILDHLLGDPRTPLRRGHLLVQWEFAAKVAAIWPATVRSIHWRAWYDVEIAGRLSRFAFSPAPSVDAAVLRVGRRRLPLVDTTEHARYRAFLSDAFATRKPLPRALHRHLTPRQLRRQSELLGFAPSALPRDLDARQWAALYVFTREGR
jgi:23S rRNA (adenine-N6)-dimethyltransferase